MREEALASAFGEDRFVARVLGVLFL
jgi:hypothetical protein